MEFLLFTLVHGQRFGERTKLVHDRSFLRSKKRSLEGRNLGDKMVAERHLSNLFYSDGNGNGAREFRNDIWFEGGVFTWRSTVAPIVRCSAFAKKSEPLFPR